MPIKGVYRIGKKWAVKHDACGWTDDVLYTTTKQAESALKVHMIGCKKG